jgi:microcystin degradation protein MlrC
VPASKPTIPLNPASKLRMSMEKLRAEDRPFVHFMHNGNPIWLVRSTACTPEEDLKKLWEELQESEVSTDRSFVFKSW